LPVERRASLSYVNTKALVDTFLPLAGPEGERVAASLGLKQLGEMVAVTGLDKEGMVSRTLLKIEGEPQGLLTLVNGEGIQAEQVDFVPKDATIAGAFSLSAQQVYSVATKLIAENAPGGQEEIDRATREFEQMFGLKLKEDLLASLGDVWTVYMSPADGWFGVTATVEVRDRAKLVKMLTKVQAMLSDVPPEQAEYMPRIETAKFGNHEIHMLVARGMPIQPAWCITEKRVVVGLMPQTIKAYLSIKPSEVGLFAHAEFAPAFAGEGKTIAVGYQDTAKLFETTYSYVSIFLPMMLDEIEGRGPFSPEPTEEPRL
jgi:hypothetical protein